MATLILTVDVHEDMPWGRVQAQTTLRSVAGLDRLQAACDRLGVRPTYFCSWPVAARASASPLPAFLAAGRCELGALLHPWVTPPFDANENRLQAVSPHRLSGTAVLAKATALTDALRALAVQPRAFRAGLFGLGGPVIQAIERLGYTIDSSVTPHWDNTPEGGPDHRAAPDVPYFPDRQLVDRRGASHVLEVPLGIGYTRGVPEAVAHALSRLSPGAQAEGLLNSVAGLRRLWLHPAVTPFDQLCKLAETWVTRDMPLLHLYVRSTELCAGTSAHSPSEVEASANLEKTERFLAYALHSVGAVPRTLSEFASTWADGG